MWIPAIVLKRYLDEYMKRFEGHPVLMTSCKLDGVELEFFNYLVEKYKDVDFYKDATMTKDIYRVWDKKGYIDE